MSSINQSIQTNSLNEISLIKESINIYQRKSGVLALCSEQNQWTQTLSPKQLLGPHAQSHDYLIGLIAYGVYLKDWKNLHGVERLNALQLKEIGIDPSLLRDKSTGFEANICRFNELYIISFAGSDELVDFYADLRQGLGYFEPQYFQAVNLTNILHRVSKGNMICIGHSLGGGLATFAALASQTPCIAFSSAGVSANTIKQIGMDYETAKQVAKDGLVRFYVVRYDWLDLLQSVMPFPPALGNKIVLDYYKGEKTWRDWLPHRLLTRNFIAHTMPKILKMMCHFTPWVNKQAMVNDDFNTQLEEFSCNFALSHDSTLADWQNSCENSIKQGNVTEFSTLLSMRNKPANFNELLGYAVRSTDPRFMKILLSSAYTDEIRKTSLPQNRTYLHLAAQSGRLEQLEVLLAEGVEINAVDDLGNTSLHDALGSHALSVAEFLLSQGADWRIKNYQGYDCRDVLVNHMIKVDMLSAQGKRMREKLQMIMMQ
ncbi:ankyrin repeat domain-containing protein [Providencia stuartii]|uniref:ankyrin repeat domain-containing protein n=1 Tax=Providencia stuartii TaxID=588 RepID=UPI003D7FEBEB